MQHAINAYQMARYQEARDKFAALEAETDNMNPKGYCRYLVYRGLTLRELAVRKEAHRFLSQGKIVCGRGEPNWLPEKTARELDAALEEHR